MWAPPPGVRERVPEGLEAEPLDQVTLSAPSPGGATGWARTALAAVGLVAAGIGLAGPAQAAGFEPQDPFATSHVEPFGPGQGGIHHDHSSNWDRNTSGSGWFIPRNPDPRPVEARFAFEVPEGTADLGPVRILDNTRGKIQALRLQWPAETDPRAADAHRAMFEDLLTQVGQDVQFHIVAEAGGVGELRSLVEELGASERVTIHSLSLHSNREEWVQAMSMWSRDSSVTLTRLENGEEVLLLPRSFRDDGQVDAYLNRVLIQSSGAAPAALLGRVPNLTVRRSTLDFEGGDVIANGRHVLVSGNTITENARRLGVSNEEASRRFAREFGREVIVISPEPDFHLDLGLGFLDDHTVTVADPSLARLDEGGSVTSDERARMVEATREKGLQEKYDAAARTLAEHGYRVVRMPNLAGESLQSPYLTYQNVLIENYTDASGRQVKRVYLPVYGLPRLDATAADLYRAEGFEVVPIDAALLSTRLGGGIRCAVGELVVLN